MQSTHPDHSALGLSNDVAKALLERLAKAKTVADLQGQLRQELLAEPLQRQLQAKALDNLRARKLLKSSPLAKLARRLGLSPKMHFKGPELSSEVRRVREGTLRALTPGADGTIASKELLARAMKAMGLNITSAKAVEAMVADKGGKFTESSWAPSQDKALLLKRAVQKDLGTKELHFETKKPVAPEKEKLDGLMCTGIKKGQDTPFTIKLVKFVDGKAVDQLMLEAGSEKELRALLKAVSGKAKAGKSLTEAAREAIDEVDHTKKKDRDQDRGR